MWKKENMERKNKKFIYIYLTLRSISSLNNPQNSEMNFCENMKFNMLKIIIIIIGLHFE